jgi:hypothetical protein
MVSGHRHPWCLAISGKSFAAPELEMHFPMEKLVQVLEGVSLWGGGGVWENEISVWCVSFASKSVFAQCDRIGRTSPQGKITKIPFKLYRLSFAFLSSQQYF